jgi:hypothetical protein
LEAFGNELTSKYGHASGFENQKWIFFLLAADLAAGKR